MIYTPAGYEARVDINAFATRLVQFAQSLGYPGTDPVSLDLTGPDSDTNQSAYTGTTIRKFIFSSTQPAMPSGLSPVIWFNPGTREFRKSGNWNSTTTWDLISKFIDLFVENAPDTAVAQNNSGLVNGVAQVPILLQGTPSQPNEASTKAYVDMAIASIAAGGSSVLYGPPVQSIADLEAVDVTGVPDKQIRLVEDVQRIYEYDLQSTAVADGLDVVAPTTGTGRWISTNPNIIDGGTI